jgi:hypothetical protein
MVAKLKAIKAELQRRKHHRSARSANGFERLSRVITNTTRCLVTRLSCIHSGTVFADSGEIFWYVAANARRSDGSVSPH